MNRDSGLPGGRAEPADPRTGSPAEGAAESSAGEPRQRWRMTFSRVASDQPQRDFVGAWIDGLAGAGLPLVGRGPGRGRPALALGAPLPLGLAAQRELADVTLTERLPVWRVREAVCASLPDGCGLVDLHDVWLGAPSLPSVVAGAQYRVTLAPGGDPGPAAVRRASRALLDADALPRERTKGGRAAIYDLRPLLDTLDADDGPPTTLRLRVRFDPARGAGRPEEVLAALSERLDRPVVAGEVVRERLVLADGQDDAERRAGGERSDGPETDRLPV